MFRQPVPSVAAAEAHERLARPDGERPLLVDVRNPDEFVQARVAGSLLVPLPVLAGRATELPADRPLLLICHSGERSAAATSFLLRSGFGDVANVEGGIVAWYRAGLPLVDGALAPGEGDLPG
jgi:rhodanese-related sulfurtransferase